VRRQGDDREVAIFGLLLDYSRDGETVKPGQLNVHQDQVRTALFDHFECLGTRRCRFDLIVVRFQDVANQLQVERIVLNDQDGLTGHGCDPGDSGL